MSHLIHLVSLVDIVIEGRLQLGSRLVYDQLPFDLYQTQRPEPRLANASPLTKDIT